MRRSRTEAPAWSYLIAHRYFPWDLVDDLPWMALQLAPIALCSYISAKKDALSSKEVRRLGVGLFLLGPVEWHFWVWGFGFLAADPHRGIAAYTTEPARRAAGAGQAGAGPDRRRCGAVGEDRLEGALQARAGRHRVRR